VAKCNAEGVERVGRWGKIMDFSKIGLFKLLADKMDWHTQRQQVLAQNIANADTPDYQARELVNFDFRKEMRQSARLEPVATTPGHLAGTVPPGSDFKNSKLKTPYETAPDGNAVVLEEQMMKVGKNASDFQTITNLYRKQIGMFKTVLGRGG
jgi:flagellar basal-body rod protein FlgB